MKTGMLALAKKLSLIVMVMSTVTLVPEPSMTQSGR